jgi:molybdopterin converting factor small subunit
MAKILIPTPLRPYAENQASVEVTGGTVAEALDHLLELHAGMRRHLMDDAGRIRSFVNVYVNDEDIRHLRKTETTLGEADVITIVPSVAGGC